jgi:hypothetical protein
MRRPDPTIAISLDEVTRSFASQNLPLAAEWLRLSEEGELRITQWQHDIYRGRAASWIFPNGLEVLMTWTRG